MRCCAVRCCAVAREIYYGRIFDALREPLPTRSFFSFILSMHRWPFKVSALEVLLLWRRQRRDERFIFRIPESWSKQKQSKAKKKKLLLLFIRAPALHDIFISSRINFDLIISFPGSQSLLRVCFLLFKIEKKRKNFLKFCLLKANRRRRRTRRDETRCMCVCLCMYTLFQI